MDRREELEQQLWEFVFDLLPPKQAEVLRLRITSDPEVARLYAETKLQADIVGEAVKLRHPRIQLAAPATNGDTGAGTDAADAATTTDKGASSDDAPVPAHRRRGQDAGRLGNWFVTIAAAMLVCYLGYAYYRPRSPIRDVAFRSAQAELVNQTIQTTVLGAEQSQVSPANFYTVLTKTATGEPCETDVNVHFYGADNQSFGTSKYRTDSNGIAQIMTGSFPGSPLVRMVFEPVTAAGTSVKASVQLPVRDQELSTHLTSDRSLYRPGDTVQYRSVTLYRYDLQPPAPTRIAFSVLDPQGRVVPGSQQSVETDFGVGSGVFALPEEQPAGRYELVARSPESRFAEVRRVLQVRQYRTPELRKKLDFIADSYAAGDEVVADLTVRGADGELVRNTPLEVVASVDDHVRYNRSTATDDEGKYQIRFGLPEQFSRGKGLVQVTVGDNLQERIVKPIPLNLESVSVQFYPESGDLVAGVENRVYFFAHDPQEKPVSIQGQIVDDGGERVASVRTLRDGRGVFALTPSADKRYELELQTKVELTSDPHLPKTSQRQFVTLNTGPGVFAAESSLKFELHSSRSDALISVTAVCRGSLVGQATIPADQFTASPDAGASCKVSMGLSGDASGVMRLTAYDYSSFPPEPVAERLVYRRPSRQLTFDVSGPTGGLAPGSQVDLALSVSDENGTRMPAMLGVSVVDEAALSLVDDGSASLTTHFWLTGQIEDVGGLEDANFYLQDDATSTQSLDLLLGTQGWRRFQPLPTEQFALAGRYAYSRDETESGRDGFGLVVGEPTAPQLLVDNRQDAFGAVAHDLESLRHTFESSLRQIGRVLFFGGLALVISLVVLAAMRRATAPIWIPALGAGALCLVLGGVWMAAQIEQSHPLASLQTTGDESATHLARGRAGTEVEVAEEELLLDEESPADDIALRGGRALPATAMPAAPETAGEAPTVESARSFATQQRNNRLLEHAIAESARGEGVAVPMEVIPPKTREYVAEKKEKAAGQMLQMDAERAMPSLAIPSPAALAASGGSDAARGIQLQQDNMHRRRASEAGAGRSAGLGGGGFGGPADSPAKAMRSIVEDPQPFGDLAENQRLQSLGKEIQEAADNPVPETPAAETPSQPAKKPARRDQRQHEEPLGDADFFAKDDSIVEDGSIVEDEPLAAEDTPQPEADAMPSEFDIADAPVAPARAPAEPVAAAPVSADPAPPVVREPLARREEEQRQPVASDDTATRQLAESRRYKFQPLVRQYATWRSPSIEPYAAETIYWNPLLVAHEDAPTTLSFRLSDSETTYRLLINGHGGGRLGSFQETIIAAPRDAE